MLMNTAVALDSKFTPINIEPFDSLEAEFNWNGRSYRFANTFGTVFDRDAAEMSAIIRSLRFICS